MARNVKARLFMEMDTGKAKAAWLGSRKCDYCGHEVMKEGEVFYDAQTRGGPWACMCKSCFADHGYGDAALGLGHGQKYAVMAGVLRKVAG